jgi:hypothetical protein
MDGLNEIGRRRAGNLPVGVAAATKVTVLPPDDNRLYLLIRNVTANPVNIAFDQQATESQGYPMVANQEIVFPNADSVPYAYVTAYSVLGTTLQIITVSRQF